MATIFHQFRRDTLNTLEKADEVINVSEEQRLAYFMAMGNILRGWATGDQGELTEGIGQMRQGIAEFLNTGAAVLRPYWLGLLAEECGNAGQADEGLSLLAEARAVVQETGERMWEAELHRLQGELLLKRGAAWESPLTQREAESWYTQALDIARRQSAKSLELRAAVSLGQLWREQGKHSQARQLVAEIFGEFSEGFETVDLIAAREMLEQIPT